jgi:hypothetical protein
MLNHHTYYRSSLGHGGWKVRSGYGYSDPISGQRWLRSPLNFAYLGQLHVSSQALTSAGLHVQFRNHSTSATGSGTEVIDVWVTAHGTPYIVRYTETAAGTVSGKRVSESVDTRLTRFNQPVTIAAPTLGA